MISNLDNADPLPEWVLVNLFASTSFFYAASILLLGVLLILSALISGAEAAFFSLSAEELAHYRNHYKTGSNPILLLLEKPKQLLATILVFNSFINVCITGLCSFAVWQAFHIRTLGGLAVLLLVFLITFAIVFFGEVLPKVYAREHKTTFLRLASYPLLVSSVLFSPLSWLLVRTTNLIEGYIHRKGYKISVDELDNVLQIYTGSDTTPEEREILKGIVHFGTVSARQIMQPRVDVTGVSIDLDFHELMDKINKAGYSRIPVYDESIDKVEGILYIKDLLPHLEENEDFNWHSLMRKPYFIPENKKIDGLLRDFQSKRVHMAIVVDEYGGTSGLVTLEDIIEEIVGEIHDEFDEDDKSFTQLDAHTFVFEGKISLNDFCRIVGTEAEVFDEVRGDSESLGGLLLELFSRLPTTGEKTTFEGFTFTVISVDSKKIKRVRVTLRKPEVQEKAPENGESKARTA